MKSYLITALTCTALGAVGGIALYKRLNPKAACPAIQEDTKSTETRTIWRYETKEGKPVVKEVIVSEKTEKRSVPLLTPRPKNILGATGRLTPEGTVKVGPVYGRELFPNTYVTGGVLITPKGRPAPEALFGIQLLF